MAPGFARARERLELWLEAERDQLPLWLPVALGAGIAGWFALPNARAWSGLTLGALAMALIGVAFWRHGRAARALAVGAAMVALGCALVWWRAERVAAPVLARPAVVQFDARVERVEPLDARELVRLTLAPIGAAGLPPRVRVNLAKADAPAGLTRGAVIHLGARLMPPPPPSVPGAYDFAQVAWFSRIGATGRGFAPVELRSPGERASADLRARLTAHIQSRLAGSEGGIASAFATGDQGAIAQSDSDAMRYAGLAHLLSVSGLHVTAVTGAAMLIVLRLLALSATLALRWRLPLVAAGAGAAAAIGYTWLTGAEVPTMRSCAAALLVLLALTLGREAVTLRLVAAGAFIVLLLWPEVLAGPSFQLSFAAVTAIVALHEHPRVRGWFERREEGRLRRIARELASLLLTGVVVEAVLAPIGVYHFHQAGIYGAFANILAIPLTTFVVMPLEALALLLDLAGMGTPVWWLVGKSLALLLWIAHAVASTPGAVAQLPAMPNGAFALMVAGGLWALLWRTWLRWTGLVPLAIGAGWALATPAPDLLVTGDGRHLAVRLGDGRLALLRDRAGDYTRSMLAQNGGVDNDLPALTDAPDANCSPDLCLVDVRRGNRRWRVLATRSVYPIPIETLAPLCRSSDVVVSERRLPRRCVPRWLKLDRGGLARSGGVAITFATGHVASVRAPAGRHPWVDPPSISPPRAPQPGEKRR